MDWEITTDIPVHSIKKEVNIEYRCYVFVFSLALFLFKKIKFKILWGILPKCAITPLINAQNCYITIGTPYMSTALIQRITSERSWL